MKKTRFIESQIIKALKEQETGRRAQVAIEALKERGTLAALSTRFEVHPN